MPYLPLTQLPAALAQAQPPPDGLYYKGSPDCLQVPRLGVVGSRNASPAGLYAVATLLEPLIRSGVCIVSGLAYGIDHAAHQVVAKGKGLGIAVLGTPVSRIYPATHEVTADALLRSGGLIVSEYPDTMVTGKHHFVARNRLIAGLSPVLLVVEAAIKSGALHTVQFALEVGHTVAVVPGEMSRPTAAGTNKLIQEGATVVTSAQDLAQLLGVEVAPLPKPQLTPDQEAVYGALSTSPATVWQLAARLSWDPARVMLALSALNQAGYGRSRFGTWHPNAPSSL